MKIEKKLISSTVTPSSTEGPLVREVIWATFAQQIADANPERNLKIGGSAIRVNEHFIAEAEALIKEILDKEPAATVDSIVKRIKDLPYYQDVISDGITIPDTAMKLFVANIKS